MVLSYRLINCSIKKIIEIKDKKGGSFKSVGVASNRFPITEGVASNRFQITGEVIIRVVASNRYTGVVFSAIRPVKYAASCGPYWSTLISDSFLLGT